MLNNDVIRKSALLLCLAFAAVAQANLIDCDIAFSDDPALEMHSYDIDTLTNTVNLHEGSVDSIGADPSLTCDGTISAALTLQISVDATNDSGIAWTGWLLELDPMGTATFTDTGVTPTSSHFMSYTISNGGYTMQFDAPDCVAPGEIMDLDFFISIPWDGSGSFNFCLTQTAIPEPATAALLGVGLIVFISRRRTA